MGNAMQTARDLARYADVWAVLYALAAGGLVVLILSL